MKNKIKLWFVNFFKLLLTNWINIGGLYIAMMVFMFLPNFFSFGVSYHNLTRSFFAAHILVSYYGIYYWRIFLPLLLFFEIIVSILIKNNYAFLIILFEWLLIVLTFLYLIFIGLNNGHWMNIELFNAFIIAYGIIVFLFTQILRIKKIKKIYNNK